MSAPTEEAVRVESLGHLDQWRICYWKHEHGWWIYLPGCGVGRLVNHTVTEHDDGTITVAPSILLTGRNGSRHGFLERGKWREA